MNILSPFAHFFTIRKAVPPVAHSYIPPLSQALPKEIATNNFDSEDHDLLVSFLGLENRSAFVLSDVRIKLKSPLEYEPRVSTNDPRGYCAYKYSSERNEILIEAIDPGEGVYIELFPDASELVHDFEPTIIVNGEILSRTMKFYGSVLRDPQVLLPILAVLIALCSVVFSGLIAWKTAAPFGEGHIQRQMIEQASERLGGGCTMKVIDVDSETKDKYLSSAFQESMALNMNDVETLEVLLKKRKIVVCSYD